MPYYILFFATGIWLLQQQAALPEANWVTLFWVVSAPALVVLILLPSTLPRWQRVIRFALFSGLCLALGFFYAAFFAQQRLSENLPVEWEGKDIEIIGVVADLPRQHERGLRLPLDVEQVLTPHASVPQHIILSTYDEPLGKFKNSSVNRSPNKTQREPLKKLTLRAGERWQLTVRLKQPHGTSNPHNFDFEVWMLERKLRAQGYIHRKGNNIRLNELVKNPDYLIQRMRENLRDAFTQTLGNAPYAGVLIALAIGDQASIPQAQWQIFTDTGVNHLMSISGLHITMLSGLAFALSYALWRRSTRLTLALPARKAASCIALLVAISYALLAGFGVPAQRTVYMLATITVLLWFSRISTPSQILTAALLIVLLIDPWAVLAPGFWLSFGAVALIFYVTSHRLGYTKNKRTDTLPNESPTHFLQQTLLRPLRGLLSYGRIQWAITIGLIPPLLAMFQQVSIASPIANAFAIPLVSLVVVPLTLAGALLPLEWPLWWAHEVMRVCVAGLTSLPAGVWVQHAPPTWTVVVGMAGVLWTLLPRGFPARWWGLFALLPMFLIPPAALPAGTLRLLIFDVGQGLAVVAQTRNHALLYDTGPDFSSEANSGNRILIPALRGMGITQLDGLLLTHNDSDHTGGARSILQTLPIDWVSSSLTSEHELMQLSKHSSHCAAGQHWNWDGVQFEILHPDLASYTSPKISDNNRSCVLKISTGAHSILLTADIERKAEQQLLQHYAHQLPSTLLIVPHHGSKTSSTADFVAAVHPQYAVVTAGYRNRYGHPKQEVINRYLALGSEVLRSDEDGAIEVIMTGQKFNLASHRKKHARYWHPAVSVAAIK